MELNETVQETIEDFAQTIHAGHIETMAVELINTEIERQMENFDYYDRLSEDEKQEALKIAQHEVYSNLNI